MTGVDQCIRVRMRAPNSFSGAAVRRNRGRTLILAQPFHHAIVVGEEDNVADRDPNLVTSSLSRKVDRGGVTVRVEIYRIEDRGGWILEVVNSQGTSTVWDEVFDTDKAADVAFREALEAEGMTAFLDSATIIPFRR
ncbi:hypothetical protein M9978_18915 [Sphingomonas sp. MG17]|uniref:Uncharacterized protein n=1 Tax=Sphingomonas tagetis TaxID=2949092 RepID=A0A9X2HRZ2_9SPHN|nr:hypothetical protein [Sphingomonas tagetis]MCP3732499.1 hypothetical protein [Sphingomonas tagetis]